MYAADKIKQSRMRQREREEKEDVAQDAPIAGLYQTTGIPLKINYRAPITNNNYTRHIFYWSLASADAFLEERIWQCRSNMSYIGILFDVRLSFSPLAQRLDKHIP